MIDETVRARLETLTQRRRHPTPELKISIEGWPPEMLAAARWVWARRVFNETGSIQIASRLRSTATAAGVTEPALVAALVRLEEDEAHHAALARSVLELLGGQMPAAPPNAPEGDPSEGFLRLVLVGLGVCETVSAARYAAVRTHTDRPVFRDCIELFLRDEIVHSELGFLLLPTALARLAEEIGSNAVPAFVHRELRAVFRELDQTIGLNAERRGGLEPPRPQPPENPGVVEPAVDARAFYEAVHETILPRLERLGIAAAKAWAER
jgi:hypothetical protein